MFDRELKNGRAELMAAVEARRSGLRWGVQ
jgi:hypothetical protein